MNEFLNMGGYGFYVWTAYGIFFAVLGWSLIAPYIRRKRVIAQQREMAAKLERVANDPHS